MFGNYDREELIGSGTFGNVFLVRCKASGNSFVMKEVRINSMSATERQQALTEVAVLKRCRHKNIIRYKEAAIDKEKGLLCIVMEYAECGDMYAAIKRQQGVYFNEADVVSWFIQITLALQYIHSRNILHRDLKTQNIFLTSNKLIKIGDFGIARVLKEDKELATTAIGTPYYLSPEICQRKPYNCKSDIWALGCVLFEMAALIHPFQGRNFHQLVCSILKVQHKELPSHTGPLIQDLIKILLAADPEERPSADEILAIPALQPHIYKYIEKHTSPPKFAPVPAERIDSLKKYNGSRRFSADDVLSGIPPPASFTKRHPSVSESRKGTTRIKKPEFIPFRVLRKSQNASVQYDKPSKPGSHISSELQNSEAKFQKRRACGPNVTPSPPTKKSDASDKDSVSKNPISKTYTLFKKALGKSNSSMINKSPSRRRSVPNIERDCNATYRSVRSSSDACSASRVSILQSVTESPQREHFSPVKHSREEPDDVFLSVNSTTHSKSQIQVHDHPMVSPDRFSVTDCSHCPHVSQCFQCLLDVLWKSRILSRDESHENERIKLRNKLLRIIGRERFEKVYQTMFDAWENTCGVNDAMKSVLQMLEYDQRQFVPLFMQLIQLDLVSRPSPVCF